MGKFGNVVVQVHERVPGRFALEVAELVARMGLEQARAD